MRHLFSAIISSIADSEKPALQQLNISRPVGCLHTACPAKHMQVQLVTVLKSCKTSSQAVRAGCQCSISAGALVLSYLAFRRRKGDGKGMAAYWSRTRQLRGAACRLTAARPAPPPAARTVAARPCRVQFHSETHSIWIMHAQLSRRHLPQLKQPQHRPCDRKVTHRNPVKFPNAVNTA